MEPQDLLGTLLIGAFIVGWIFYCVNGETSLQYKSRIAKEKKESEKIKADNQIKKLIMLREIVTDNPIPAVIELAELFGWTEILRVTKINESMISTLRDISNEIYPKTWARSRPERTSIPIYNSMTPEERYSYIHRYDYINHSIGSDRLEELLESNYEPTSNLHDLGDSWLVDSEESDSVITLSIKEEGKKFLVLNEICLPMSLPVKEDYKYMNISKEAQKIISTILREATKSNNYPQSNTKNC